MPGKAIYVLSFIFVALMINISSGDSSQRQKTMKTKHKQSHGNGRLLLPERHLRNITTRLQQVICDEICNPEGCTIYYCPDGYICCTPGSPTSKCCQDDHPICVTGGCCPSIAPTECGEYCCETGSSCCDDVNCCEDTAICCSGKCCDVDELCCASECCEAGALCCASGCCNKGELRCGNDCCALGKVCCSGTDCCGTCCANTCCGDNQICCGGKECCDDTSSICCDEIGCHTPCTSQFDELPCSESTTGPGPIEVNVVSCPNISTYVYRVIRPDEDPKIGLLARGVNGSKTPDSQVGCGSRDTFKSQYIALTTSLDIAHSYYNISKDKGLNPRLAMVKYDDVKKNAQQIYDFTIPGKIKG